MELLRLTLKMEDKAVYTKLLKKKKFDLEVAS